MSQSIKAKAERWEIKLSKDRLIISGGYVRHKGIGKVRWAKNRLQKVNRPVGSIINTDS